MRTVDLTTQKMRMVLKAPDGTYKYAFQHGGDDDSYLEGRKLLNGKGSQRQLANGGGGGEDQLSYMDEELQFILENFEFQADFADEMLNDYFYNRRVFFILIMVQFFMQIYIVTLTWIDRDLVFLHFNQLYRNNEDRHIKEMFFAALLLDLVVNVLAIYLAIKAYHMHSIKMFKNYSTVYAVCIVSRIILAYLNTWNVVMFIVMLFTYTYSRYMIALLYGLCLVPQRAPIF